MFISDTQRYSTCLRNLTLGDSAASPSPTGNGFSGAMAGFVVDFFPNAQPASADNAPGATAIITFSVNGDGTGGTWSVPTGGSVSRNSAEQMKGVAALGMQPQWARFRKTGDSNAEDTSFVHPRMDVSVGPSGSDLGWTQTIVSGQTYFFQNYTLRAF